MRCHCISRDRAVAASLKVLRLTESGICYRMHSANCISRFFRPHISAPVCNRLRAARNLE